MLVSEEQTQLVVGQEIEIGLEDELLADRVAPCLFLLALAGDDGSSSAPIGGWGLTRLVASCDRECPSSHWE